MADGFDGQIKLGVSLEPTDIKKTAQQLQREVSKIFDNSTGQKTSKQFQQMEIQLDKLNNKSTKLQESLKQMETTKIPTEEYKEITKQIADAEKKLAAFRAAEEKAEEIGKPLKGDRLRAMQYEVAQLENTIEYAKGELQDLVETGQAFTLGSDSQKYKDTANELNNTNNKIVQTISAVNNLNQEEEKLPEPVEQTRSSVESLKNSFSKISSLLGKVLHGLGGMAKTLGRTLVSATKKFVSHFSKLAHHTDKHQLSLKKMSRMLLKYGLGIRSIFLLWRKLRGYVTESIKAMAQNFEDVNADVSMLMNSFNQMKNSFGSMVQPLLHALAPALNYIIGLISAAATALANFFAIITGQKFIYKATKANNSFADSIGGVGGSAKEANKELGEYDNLIVIQSQNDGGGGGGGGADAGAGLFEKVKAESDLAQEIKDAVAKGDWEGVGEAFATRINIITEKFDDWLLTKFRPAALLWTERIARILNGLTEGWNGELFGKTLADTINTGFEIVNKFLTTYDFKNLGRKLADALYGLAKNISPTEIGKAFANKINAGLDLVSGFVTNFTEKGGWAELGSKIGTNISAFFNTIKWDEAGADLSGLASGIMTTLTTAIQNTDFHAVGNAIVQFLNNIDFGQLARDLSDLAKSILDGLASVDWSSIASSIGEAIAEFLNNIDFLELGLDLIGLALSIAAALADGIASAWTSMSPASKAIAAAIVGALGAMKLIGLKAALTKSIEAEVAGGIAINRLKLNIGKFLFGLGAGLAIGSLGAQLLAWICDLFGFKQYANEIRYFIAHPVKVFMDLEIGKSAEHFGTELHGAMEKQLKKAFDKGMSIDEIKLNINYDQMTREQQQWVDTTLNNYSELKDKISENAKKYGAVVTDTNKEIKDSTLETNKVVTDSTNRVGESIATISENTLDKAKKTWNSKELTGYFGDRADDVVTSFNGMPSDVEEKFRDSYVRGTGEWHSGELKEKFYASAADVTGAFETTPDDLGTIFSNAVTNVKNNFSEQSFTTHFNSIYTSITGVFSSIPQFFKTTFSDAWTEVENAFSTGSTTFNSFSGGVSTALTNAINTLAGGLNNAVNRPLEMVNELMRKYEGLRFGASSVIGALPRFNNIPVPRLAQGAVIPPNREFLATLGDQKHGTNIETPLDTMIEAFTKALDTRGGANNHEPIVLQLNSKVIAQSVWDEEDKRYKQTGR